jgi:hypothetical protein
MLGAVAALLGGGFALRAHGARVLANVILALRAAPGVLYASLPNPDSRNASELEMTGDRRVSVTGSVPSWGRLKVSLLVPSILIEAAVAIIAVLAALSGKRYALGLAVTFAIYVLYDGARLAGIEVREGIPSVLFLVAAISALVAVWGWYRS